MLVALREHGEPGAFSEGHQLDSKTVRKIPKKMIGKRLSPKQAQQLLKKLRMACTRFG
jgi:hypothetical protein